MFEKKNYKNKELELYKQTLILSDLQREILIGVLLGDASISLRDGKPVYAVKFEQAIVNKKYINHLYIVFESFVGQIPLEYKNKFIWFRTYTHSCFKFYYNLFYSKKTIFKRESKRICYIIQTSEKQNSRKLYNNLRLLNIYKTWLIVFRSTI